MRRGQLKIEWRGKVNPLFVVAIQYGRFMLRIFKELHEATSEVEDCGPRIFAQVCKETIPLLSPVPHEDSSLRRELMGRLEKMPEVDWLSAPEVREPLAEIGYRIQATSKELLRKGFTEPHWWMTAKQWSEFSQEERLPESFLNALAALHFKMPLRELKEEVIRGDPRVFARLFRIDNEILRSRQSSLENLLAGVKDEATRIVGRALALRKDPPGHQINLRMTLFFGWDFGLKDLSNDELLTFLVDMRIVPMHYEAEALQKYRNRMRQLIERTRATATT